ncbi:adenylate kinase family protein [Blattabacterium cuenoti]|uniref:adenylate kinase family protein n=1 Tax=Blattabacterium cuenoti TaxID=1653831 RepID=UPI00163C78A4|nr:nucleoside monophosphate kinase [Blattabacterium cuenoti]
MIHIILLGPPGCGKGTQARIIKKKFGYIHLSTGLIFRNHIKNNTKIGKIVNKYINNGKLVPDILTTSIVDNEIKKFFKAKGIIYDGYPRTKNQIFSLENILNKFSIGKLNIIFFFLIKENIIINRLLNRSKISGRYDDINTTVIKERIKEYNENTSLIWKDKKWEKIIIKLEGNYSINEISLFIEKNIKNILCKKNFFYEK